MIRVLIVDDSNVVAMLLKAVLDKEPDIEVVGRARNGVEAVAMVQQLQPDLVTMDVQMPEMNGFEATRQIMEKHPTPVILVSSSVNAEEVHTTFQAIDEGAVAVVEQPQLGGGGSNRYDPLAEFLRMVRLMNQANIYNKRKSDTEQADIIDLTDVGSAEIIVIASAEGGLTSLSTLLSCWNSIRLPVVINQQLAPGFQRGLMTWLRTKNNTQMKLAENKERLEGGIVYFTPDGHDMNIVRQGDNLVCQLIPFKTSERLWPCQDLLLKSVASTCKDKGLGIILSGCYDSFDGSKAMKSEGAVIFAEDKNSAFFNKALEQAYHDGVTDHYLSLRGMAKILSTLEHK